MTNGSESCAPCSTCPVGTLETHPCVDGQDTVCSCPLGQYLFKGQCRRCRRCKSGSGVVRECKGENNTRCEPCRRGTFSRSKSHVFPCRRCYKCQQHEVLVKECTSTTDTVCHCQKGYFRSSYLNRCWKCSYCYPEFPNVTFVVPACEANPDTPDSVCMPLERPPFGAVGKDQATSKHNEDDAVSNSTVHMIVLEDGIVKPEVLAPALIGCLMLLVIVVLIGVLKSENKTCKGMVSNLRTTQIPIVLTSGPVKGYPSERSPKSVSETWFLTNAAVTPPSTQSGLPKTKQSKYVCGKEFVNEDQADVPLASTGRELFVDGSTFRLEGESSDEAPDGFCASDDYRKATTAARESPTSRTLRCPLRTLEAQHFSVVKYG